MNNRKPEDSRPSRSLPYPSPWPESGRVRNEPCWEMAVCGDLTDRQSELIGRLTEIRPGTAGLLYFDSCGGSVYTGLALASLIRLRDLNAVAVVIGECSSAALLPFAACRSRFVTPFCSLLFHPMRWHSEEDVRREEAAEWARQFESLEKCLDDLLSAHLPMPAEQLREWTSPGRFVSGREMVDAGLARMIDPFATENAWRELKRATAPRGTS